MSTSLTELWSRYRMKSSEQVNSSSIDSSLFQTYKLLLHANHNLETSVTCVGSPRNQSCLFKNLYYKDGLFWMFTTKRTAYPLPDVRIGAFAIAQFTPNRRRFYTYKDLQKSVREQINPLVIPHLTLYFEQPWLSNIGHALFDGLYPGYVALIRFPPKHLEPFRILFNTFGDLNSHSFSHEVYNRFAGLGTMNISELEEISLGKWVAFQELVMGSGNLCQRCLQPNLQLPGGVELNGSRLFRDRMYKQYGFTSDSPRRNNSAERRDIQKPLQAYVIDNKRFSDEDKIQIKEAIDEMNMDTNERSSQFVVNHTQPFWPTVHVSYISYPLVTISRDGSLQFNSTHIGSANTSTMLSHLRLLRDMDIHVCGPGTGQMYQTFLRDGSMTVNLGGVRNKKHQSVAETYPSFGEQYMTAGTPYIKGLYYPINERSDGIRKEMVIQLIRKAAQIILDGFSIPVSPEENLAVDGQMFIELCKLDKSFCAMATERSEQTDFACIDAWPEDIVHENGPWSPEGIIVDAKNVTCQYNRTLLQELRHKYDVNFQI